jgi:molybdenum cofactor cytidylyltransferase
MGFPKALLPLGNSFFVARILDTLLEAGLKNPFVILGRDAPRIEARIADRSISMLINPDPSRGQLSSIQIGLRHLPARAEGCLIWPVDQPAISAKVIGSLVDLFLKSESGMAFPECAKKRGHPVIFRRRIFRELLDAPLAGGAKSVVEKNRNDVQVLRTGETATITDVDTPDDYFKLTGDMLDEYSRKHRLRDRGGTRRRQATEGAGNDQA